MLEPFRANDRLRSATECRLQAANASLAARQADDEATKHEWTMVARDWSVLAISASAEEELQHLAPPATTVEKGMPSLHRARVLVAEDNAMNQTVLTAILRLGGIEPVMANNGAEAVEAWGREPWDVILMDMQMPVLDGIGATRAIRLKEAEIGARHTPIVAVTANVLPAQIRGYFVNGMDDVVAKPIDIDQLFAALARILSPIPDTSTISLAGT